MRGVVNRHDITHIITATMSLTVTSLILVYCYALDYARMAITTSHVNAMRTMVCYHILALTSAHVVVIAIVAIVYYSILMSYYNYKACNSVYIRM